MSKTFNKLLNGKIDWQESYPSFILGAIIVVILGLLVANFISRRGAQSIDGGVKTEQKTEASMAPKAGSEYTIREGDSLSKISESVYGTQENWTAIASANKITNPNRVLVGDKINLPAKEEMGKGTVADASSMSSEKTYQVAEGDTFFTIAQKVYGDGSKWTVLFGANGARRLPNGNPLVYSGTTIVVPR